MAIFGAEGIREAMLNSYRKHFELAQARGTPSGTSAHEAGLYEALATRYLTGFQQVAEPVVWAELTPFLRLQHDVGVSALAEYVVYKEMAKQARTDWLRQVINEGLRSWPEEECASRLAMARLMGIAWINLA